MTHVKKKAIEAKAQHDSFSDEAKAVAAAKLAYPQWANSMCPPVRVNGSYRVFAIGIVGDVTILVWLHADGDATVKHQCW